MCIYDLYSIFRFQDITYFRNDNRLTYTKRRYNYYNKET